MEETKIRITVLIPQMSGETAEEKSPLKEENWSHYFSTYAGEKQVEETVTEEEASSWAVCKVPQL